MNNQTQGSASKILALNAPILQDFPTIKNRSLAETLTQLHAQIVSKEQTVKTQLAPESSEVTPEMVVDAISAAVPKCKSYKEISIERAERRGKSKAHYLQPRRKPNTWQSYEVPVTPEGVQKAEERPMWLIDALESLERPEVAPIQPAQKLRRQVQRKPLPLFADLLNLEQYRPKRGRGFGTAGAGALAELLHEQARTALASRLYLYDDEGNPPPQIVLHLCDELIAGALGISDNTLREWRQQLTQAGYLYARAHKTVATLDGKEQTAIDGMLYAVRLAPGHTARLRYEDYKRKYRNLDADRAAGRTAYNAIRNAQRRAEVYVEEQREAQNLNAVLDDEKNTEGSLDLTGRVQAELREQLRRWAVIPGNITTENPLTTDPSVFSPEEVAERLNGVQDVVYLLPTLTAAHQSKRAALVDIMAAAIARDLNDPGSRAYYCKIIWQTWQDELEGRSGLQHLAAQLQRLEVDRREWKELRNPAALLAARLRAA